MRLIIKFTTIIIVAGLFNICFASRVRIEYRQKYKEIGIAVSNNFTRNHNIPTSLISLVQVSQCNLNHESGVLKVCIDNKKGPEITSDPNIYKSLRVFGELK